jgi:hypothetical protein
MQQGEEMVVSSKMVADMITAVRKKREVIDEISLEEELYNELYISLSDLENSLYKTAKLLSDAEKVEGGNNGQTKQ